MHGWLEVQSFCYLLPCPLQDALSSASQSENVTLANLLQHWRQDHALLRHEDQPELRIPEANVFKQTPCLKAGCCLCSEHSKPRVKLLKDLVKCLKPHFLRVKKKPSPERVVMEQWRLVLRLASGEGEGTCELYLHVGAANFTTWELTCLRMQEYHRAEDHVTLQVRRQGAQQELEVRTLAQFILKYIDPVERCTVTCLSILVDKKEVDADLMQAQYIDVATLLPEAAFWEGQLPQQRQRRKRRCAPPLAGQGRARPLPNSFRSIL